MTDLPVATGISAQLTGPDPYPVAMPERATGRGWEFVSEHEGMAPVLGAIVQLDPEAVHTRSELADAAGVPLKDLYLADTLTALTDAGVLDPVNSGGESAYTIDDDSAVYERAADFEQALAETVD